MSILSFSYSVSRHVFLYRPGHLLVNQVDPLIKVTTYRDWQLHDIHSILSAVNVSEALHIGISRY